MSSLCPSSWKFRHLPDILPLMDVYAESFVVTVAGDNDGAAA